MSESKLKTVKKTVKKEPRKEVKFSEFHKECLDRLKDGDLSNVIVKLIKEPKLTSNEKDSLLANCRRYMQNQQGYILQFYKKFEHLVMNLK